MSIQIIIANTILIFVAIFSMWSLILSIDTFRTLKKSKKEIMIKKDKTVIVKKARKLDIKFENQVLRLILSIILFFIVYSIFY